MTKAHIAATLFTAFTFAMTVSACGKKDDDKSSSTDPQVETEPTKEARKSAEKKVVKAKSKAKTAKPRVVAPTTETTPAPEVTPPDVSVPGTELVPAPFELTESYHGASLTLIYPHASNWGWILVSGDEAKELYDSLAVETLVSDVSQQRLGHDVACFAQAKRATPETIEYACSVYIDYKAGLVIPQASSVKLNDKAPKMSKGESNDTAKSLSLSGKDAEMLFNTLSVEAVETEGKSGPVSAKATEQMSCSKMSGEYTCSLSFSSQTGAVLVK